MFFTPDCLCFYSFITLHGFLLFFFVFAGKWYSAAKEKLDIVSVIQQKNRDEHLAEMRCLDLEERKIQLGV